jgi:hypothetical protein
VSTVHGTLEGEQRTEPTNEPEAKATPAPDVVALRTPSIACCPRPTAMLTDSIARAEESRSSCGKACHGGDDAHLLSPPEVLPAARERLTRLPDRLDVELEAMRGRSRIASPMHALWTWIKVASSDRPRAGGRRAGLRRALDIAPPRAYGPPIFAFATDPNRVYLAHHGFGKSPRAHRSPLDPA